MCDPLPRILIIDDEPDMCWALEHILDHKSSKMVTVGSGQEGLAALGREHFEVAFIDAKLSDMEGLELARKMRTRFPSLRIILFSGYFYKDEPDVKAALRKGIISDFVSKPFQNEEVLNKV
ncbi:MAG: response regulator [Desulfohalobiaceae bacterium]|nr:response regulator [Desulfohalobiaceae bacterium]